ncbi:hypothetical protein HNR42_000978 [Deinobacterium chartae]|uniref:Uncharacterized protein n=1 Tax=Deinobacterium chartae TaxID=521158 RepID=A0A841HVM5_9DEIO|nr:hypothetical protein [Deinobacterium chartae]MBB6097561.1 hypothetical protein [Deinobacterium chartae]
MPQTLTRPNTNSSSNATAQAATVYLEVLSTLPGQNTPPAPEVRGWTLRMWPYAALGDFILEARALEAGRSLQDLIAQLGTHHLEVLAWRQHV